VHVGRGKWQEARIAAHKDMLKLEMNRGKVAMFTTDMKSKTVPDKHKCEQGYRMGLKGMSLHGGMLNFCNDEGIIQQHYLNLIYAQSSNQSLEEAMSGIAAMLDFIQEHYPDIETIWIVSDKCSNFNSFEQIPFVVAGNARHWVLPAAGNITAKHKKKRRGMHVEKWMCTEAQLGKDQLDCHFAWVTECFKSYLNKEGNNLILSLHMFTHCAYGPIF
jgi:hypothetical protein